VGTFVKGDVVVFPFPLSDLTAAKRRPALVVAKLDGDDVICSMITSQHKVDAISLTQPDFTSGGIKRDPSYIRPNRLFTADSKIINDPPAGKISSAKMNEVRDRIIEIISR
jgi:mRNA interferase MazF